MATFEERTISTGEKRIRAVVRRAGFQTLRATFENKKKAREWASKEETAMRDGKYRLSAAADHHTAAEMIDCYLEKVLPHKSRKVSYTIQQRAQLLWWRQRIGQYKLANVTPALIGDCRNELLGERSTATANRYMAALSHVYTIAIKEWAWLEQSPILRLSKLKESRGRVRFLSDAERDALLGACRMEKRKPLELLVVLAISTGARKMEILSLKWEDVDLERGIATVQESKNDERRPLYLMSLAKQMLMRHQHHPKSRYVFANRFGNRPVNIEREFRRAIARAGITDFHFHDLRHTSASYIAMNGGSGADIAEVLGQKSLAMVKRYTHLSKTHTAGVVESMNEKVFGKELYDNTTA